MLLAERHAEVVVDARDQFDAGQTVQTEVTFERMLQAEQGSEPRLWPQLVGQAVDTVASAAAANAAVSAASGAAGNCWTSAWFIADRFVRGRLALA